MGLLDISGFFTGLIINLLLITLVCYYFKRKYENIESAQMEQAKVLYELLSQNKSEQSYVLNKEEPLPSSEVESEEDDVESEDEDESEDENEAESESQLIEENLEQCNSDETDYNKMSVKTLRDLLTTKGIKTNNKMKKNELIRLANNKKSLVIDLAFDENPIEVEKLPEEVPEEVPEEEN